MAEGSSIPVRKPFTPSWTTEGIPRQYVLTTGFANCMASSSTKPKLSASKYRREAEDVARCETRELLKVSPDAQYLDAISERVRGDEAHTLSFEACIAPFAHQLQARIDASSDQHHERFQQHHHALARDQDADEKYDQWFPFARRPLLDLSAHIGYSIGNNGVQASAEHVAVFRVLRRCPYRERGPAVSVAEQRPQQWRQRRCKSGYTAGVEMEHYVTEEPARATQQDKVTQHWHLVWAAWRIIQHPRSSTETGHPNAYDGSEEHPELPHGEFANALHIVTEGQAHMVKPHACITTV